jgi:hypothetical protein
VRCNKALTAFAAIAVHLCACADDPGTLTVLVEPEDVIIDGLEPGDGVENIRDGWQVEFQQYIVAIGDVAVSLSTDDSVEAEAHEVFAVDLTAIPQSGEELWTISDLEPGRWNFSFATTGAAHGAERHDSVSESDFDSMKADDHTYLIRGTMTKEGGVSCPPTALAAPTGDATAVGPNAGGDECYENPTITFDWGVDAETVYGPCEVDGIPGVSVGSGSTQSVAMTIHGDHVFFNGFPEGSEGGVQRLAQWLADCDLDVDGMVTSDELQDIAPSDLPELDDRYQLGGSPLSPLDDMWTYVRAQLKTQGHFQAEGECPVDGIEHDHDH